MTKTRPMTADQVQIELALVPGWALVDGVIRRRFAFDNFHQTMAFVNAVAFIAHQQDHHPDLAVGYGECTLRYVTHSLGGLSRQDFICAARVNALLAADKPDSP